MNKLDISNTWTPSEIIRLITNLGGFILFLLGSWFLYKNIGANGSIKIKAIFVSGEINSGSAGLFVMVFSVFLITISNYSQFGFYNRKRKFNTDEKKIGEFGKTLISFFIILIVIFICMAGYAFTREDLKEAFAALGFIFGIIEIFIAMNLMSAASNHNREYYEYQVRLKALDNNKKETS